MLPEVWTRARCVDDGADPAAGTLESLSPGSKELVCCVIDSRSWSGPHWLTGLDAVLTTPSSNALVTRTFANSLRIAEAEAKANQNDRTQREVESAEEVHLWRGSAEQRALRAHLGASGQFCSTLTGNWTFLIGPVRPLRFWRQQGNLLLNPDCTIRPWDYYCVDVIQEAVEEGRKRFPEAHWIHFNRHNCSFNPEGIDGLPVPDMGIKFNMILAYSVFTHTTREEMNDLVDAAAGAARAWRRAGFTFIDPHFIPWAAKPTRETQLEMAFGTSAGNEFQCRYRSVVGTLSQRGVVRSC